MNFANKIAVAANVAIIVTCAVLVGAVAIARGPQLFRSAPLAPYQVGDVFSEVTADAQGKDAVVLVFRTNCVPCQESAAFHRTLAKRLETTPMRLIAISSEPVTLTSQYLKDKGINVAAVKSMAQLRVRSTPTLLWLDAKGTIKAIWVGRLPQDRQEQVFRSLSLPIVPSSAD